MAFFQSTTIAPWILGTLTLLALFALIVVVKSWREMKSSPYFFLRQQAAKRLQTYSFASMSLIFVTLITAVYTIQKPVDTVLRVATLSNAKPATAEVRALIDSAPTIVDLIQLNNNNIVRGNISTADDILFAETNEQLLQVALTLPETYDQHEPTTDLNNNTEITPLQFSTKIDNQYAPAEVANIFAEGNYTLYATFDYDEMADGMVWSWVWRHEGEVVDGGNEMWNYGADGPGYIYYNPDEGFQSGEYTLEVWVNSELFAQSDMLINTAAVLAQD